MRSSSALRASLQITRSNMPPPRMFLSLFLLLVPYPSMKQDLSDHLWLILTFTWKILSEWHKSGSISCKFVARPFMKSTHYFGLIMYSTPDNGIPSQWKTAQGRQLLVNSESHPWVNHRHCFQNHSYTSSPPRTSPNSLL